MNFVFMNFITLPWPGRRVDIYLRPETKWRVERVNKDGYELNGGAQKLGNLGKETKDQTGI